MMKRRVSGPMIAYDEVRVCPVCGADVPGMGLVTCGGHFKAYSFPNLRRPLHLISNQEPDMKTPPPPLNYRHHEARTGSGQTSTTVDLYSRTVDVLGRRIMIVEVPQHELRWLRLQARLGFWIGAAVGMGGGALGVLYLWVTHVQP